MKSFLHMIALRVQFPNALCCICRVCYTILFTVQDMTNSRPSPIPGRAFSHFGGSGQPASTYGSPARGQGANSFGSPARSLSGSQGPGINQFGSPVRLVETTLTTDPEQSVAKISSMFPTVTENHIKSLLMK